MAASQPKTGRGAGREAPSMQRRWLAHPGKVRYQGIAPMVMHIPNCCLQPSAAYNHLLPTTICYSHLQLTPLSKTLWKLSPRQPHSPAGVEAREELAAHLHRAGHGGRMRRWYAHARLQRRAIASCPRSGAQVLRGSPSIGSSLPSIKTHYHYPAWEGPCSGDQSHQHPPAGCRCPTGPGRWRCAPPSAPRSPRQTPAGRCKERQNEPMWGDYIADMRGPQQALSGRRQMSAAAGICRAPGAGDVECSAAARHGTAAMPSLAMAAALKPTHLRRQKSGRPPMFRYSCGAGARMPTS